MSKIPPDSWYFNVAPEFKKVSKEEFKEYLNNYPRELVFDAYRVCEPASLTWNDFELADRWPYSIIARTSDYDEFNGTEWEIPEEERTYSVLANIEEVFANRTRHTAEEWEKETEEDE